MLVLRTREDLQVMLGSKACAGRIVSAIGNEIFRQKGIVFISDMPKWKVHRSAALRGLLRPSFLKRLFATSMVPVADDFVAHVEASGTVFDVADLSALTLEIIGEAALSLCLCSFPRASLKGGTGAKSDDLASLAAFRDSVHGILRGLTLLGTKPGLLLPFYSAERAKVQAASRVMMEFMEAFIAQRKAARANGSHATPSGEPDFLDILLESAEAEEADSVAGEAHFTHADIAYTLQDMMIAGHETTSHTLAWALFFLAQDRELQERVANEVVGAWGPDGEPEYASLASLDLVQAVIKETLRLRPTVPSLMRRTLEDTEINGLAVPADTVIMGAPYTLGLDPDEYPSPETFDADRWLANPGLKLPFVFGAGPRSCIGERMAMIEAKLALSVFVRAFAFTLITPPDDVDMFQSITMCPHPKLELSVSRRVV